MTAKIKSSRTNHERHKPRGLSDRAFEKVYWPYLPLILIMVFLVGISFQSGALQAAWAKHQGKVLSYASSMSISGLLEDTNSDRSANGAAPLTLNDQLARAAQAKANDMVSRNYWSHNTPDGNEPWVFVTDQGYSYQKLGENLATGFSSELATVNAWMASPHHRENLLDPDFTQVGFGYANSTNYSAAGGGPMTVVVAFYGRPASAAAVLQGSGNSPTKIEVANSNAPSSVLANESAPTSRVQLALAKLPFSNLLTGITLVAVGLAAGLWIGRHLLAVRRAWRRSEKWALSHPLFDIGLLIITALLLILHQTAGFVR